MSAVRGCRDRAGRCAPGSPSRPSAGSRPRRRGRSASPVVVVHERAGVDERADELLEEERIALGGLEDPPLHVGGQRAVADRARAAARGRRRRTAPRASSSRVRCGSSRATSSFTRHARVVALRPRREDEQERASSVSREQPFEELQRRRVGPVQVLERDRDGSVLREAREQRRGRPRTSGTAAPRARAPRGVPPRPAPASARAARRGTGRARPRASPNEPLDHAGGARRAPAAPARRRGRRATSAGGRGTASTASTRRRRRTCPRARARGRAAASRRRTGRGTPRGAASCRSRARPVTSRMPPVPARTPATASRPASSSRSRPTNRACTPSRPRVRTAVAGRGERRATPRPGRTSP